MADTYQRQKLWNDYRKSKIDRNTSERDQKAKEELTFQPKINKGYNAKRKVKSRLLNSTNSTRQANVYQTKSSQRSSSLPRNSNNSTNTNTNTNNSNNSNNTTTATTATPTPSGSPLNDSNASVVRTAVYDLSDDDNDDPNNESLSSVSSVDIDDEQQHQQHQHQHQHLAGDDYGINPPQSFARQTSTGISLHIARQRQARLRKKEIKSGKAYRTKRAALNARPFNLSTSNARLANGSHNTTSAGSSTSFLHHSGITTGDLGASSTGVGDPSSTFMGLFGQNSSGVTDADIRNMIREHRSEIQELRQEYAIKMKMTSDETREQQEDALIRQEVALRRLFDEERTAWHTEKTQLMTLIGSLQKEIEERAEARTHAESMARSLSSVVGTLEKRLLQVEQGAQDEIRKLRASLISGGGVGGNSKQALRNLGSELSNGVRKLMRGHENNVRGLFAGREEAAMRQTEGLRVHVESTVEHSEERISSLVEHSTDMSSTLSEVNENVSHLLTMMSSWKRMEEERRQQQQQEAAAVAAAAAAAATVAQTAKATVEHPSAPAAKRDRRGSIVPAMPPRSKVARAGRLPVEQVEAKEEHGPLDQTTASGLATNSGAATSSAAATAQKLSNKTKIMSHHHSSSVIEFHHETKEAKDATDSKGAGGLRKENRPKLMKHHHSSSVIEFHQETKAAKDAMDAGVAKEVNHIDEEIEPNGGGGGGDDGDGTSGEEQWIRVPGENGADFYFNTVNKKLWSGTGLPKNVVEAPSLDSPIIPRR